MPKTNHPLSIERGTLKIRENQTARRFSAGSLPAVKTYSRVSLLPTIHGSNHLYAHRPYCETSLLVFRDSRNAIKHFNIHTRVVAITRCSKALL